MHPTKVNALILQIWTIEQKLDALHEDLFALECALADEVEEEA